jgi:hypothetical protein
LGCIVSLFLHILITAAFSDQLLQIDPSILSLSGFVKKGNKKLMSH